MKRIIFRVQFDPRQNFWLVRGRNSRAERWMPTKQAAIKWAVYEARKEWKAGRLAQVVIYTKAGRIQSERTYGLDPERRKG